MKFHFRVSRLAAASPVVVVLLIGILIVSSFSTGGLRTASAKGPAAAPAETTNSIDMKFVRIQPGTFMMGSPQDEAGREKNEVRHKVTLTRAFMIQTTPVTQKQWKSLMDRNTSIFQGEDLPVERVTWAEAEAFCEKLSTKEGKHYRLPTEAEWEYACRAGTTTAYYAGNNEAALGEAGWYGANSEEKTHPVGQKKPNAWGLYDMHGNVSQWCQDRHGDYPAGNASDPKGPADGSSRILRGGCWAESAKECRCARRSWNGPDIRQPYYGFRVCLDL